MSDNVYATDADLEAALVDLGAFLAIPSSGGRIDAVTARLEAGHVADDASGVQWRRLLVAGVVVFLVVSAGLVAYGPTRSAIAHWLGIGAVAVTPVNELPPLPAPSSTVKAALSPPTASPSAMVDAQKQVSFPIRVPEPGLAGPVNAVSVDAAVPGGLTSINFGRFALTEIAAQPDQIAVLAKLVSPSTKIEYLKVNSRDGAWITGAPHELAYLDPNGHYRSETLRRAGNVLMWEQGGVTFRIEGLSAKDDALAIATSMH